MWHCKAEDVNMKHVPYHHHPSSYSAMLSTVARHRSSHIFPRTIVIRFVSTETATSSNPSKAPPPTLTKHPSTSKSRILDPKPRPAISHRHQALPTLPANFGRNQLLPVSNSTRALLESIVAQFNAPIRYAFAYGSGVFEQDGYTPVMAKNGEAPMLDFMFAVTHPDHWHSINMHQHPNHYALHARILGSSFVSRVEDIIPGVWFNAFVPMQGVVSGNIFWDVVCHNLMMCRPSNMASPQSIISAPIS
jgi:mitochondrial translocator assembly and maintenance protein 41